MIPERPRVKIFDGGHSSQSLEETANRWLTDNESKIEVVEIKFHHAAGQYNSGFSISIWYNLRN